jgi:hypothetical protein
MKTTKKCLLCLIICLFLFNLNSGKADRGSNVIKTEISRPDLNILTPFLPPTFQVFFDLLGPYGSWVEYGNYGYCWVPRLGVDFVPYSSNGHWVYTEHGWQWFSNYSWGWAPFHYGRWIWEDEYGWIWVPGHEWAPAWVVWGHYGGYYGWAPLGPGVSLSIGYRPPIHYWTFVPERYMADENFRRYIVHDRSIVHSNINIIFNSHSYNNVIYNRGPRVEDIERVSRRKFSPVNVREVDHPMSHHEIKGANREYKHNRPLPVYRPAIERNSSIRQNPSRVEKLENLRHNDKKGDKGNHKHDR